MNVPAQIGMPLEQVDTPALLVDLAALERNLTRMAAVVAAFPVRLRPHAKSHKSPAIARAQIARGAVGVCCQKVSEAEAMVAGGVHDVLLSNQIVGGPKLERLAALARQAKIAVCADDAGNVEQLSAAATRAGVEIDVLVEINVGAERCGVDAGAPALELARRISQSPGLRFAGLQAYQGAAQHIREFEQRRAAISSASEKAAATRDLLRRNGLRCDIITGAGTGTFQFEAASAVYGELQAGSYVFMDVDYGKNLGADGAPFRDFENALFVYATVMSHAVPGRAVVDAGLKAFSVDSGLPRVHERDELEFVGISDEHGKLRVRAGARIAVGDKIRLVPGHCDPTVNLYDCFVGVRDGRVETLWPIARGPGL